jgi:hypothetical protein
MPQVIYMIYNFNGESSHGALDWVINSIKEIQIFET